MIDGLQVLTCPDAAAWESWLRDNHDEHKGAWLKIAKKGSGQASIVIEDALQVALCFGWIDSVRRSSGGGYYLQRYSRRRAKSPWSRLNVERVEALTKAGRMHASGLAEVAAAQADGRWAAAYESQRTASIPPDLAAALARDERAKERFEGLNKSRQYAVILPVLKAATPGARAAQVEKALSLLLSEPG